MAAYMAAVDDVVTIFCVVFFPQGILVGSGIKLCQFLRIFQFTIASTEKVKREENLEAV